VSPAGQRFQPENSRRAIRRIDQTPIADCRSRAFCVAVWVFMIRNAKRGPQPVALRSGDFWKEALRRESLSARRIRCRVCLKPDGKLGAVYLADDRCDFDFPEARIDVKQRQSLVLAARGVFRRGRAIAFESDAGGT
jgi:hypothetical protein